MAPPTSHGAMNRGIVACLLVALLLMAPVANARGNAGLTLTPERRVFVFAEHAVRDIPVEVTLRLSNFACFEQAWFVVRLSAEAGDGVAARFGEERVRFAVSARSYLGETYEATTEVPLHVHVMAAGQNRLVNLVATLVPDDQACLAPGGFGDAVARAGLRIDVVERADEATFAGGSDPHQAARYPNATIPPQESQPPLTGRAALTLLGVVLVAILLRKV